MKAPKSAAGPRDPSALAWILGTLVVTALTLVWFNRWARPYLNVETEGTVQIPAERAAALTSGVSKARLEGTVRKLAGFGSRLTGSPGADRAADYLKARLAGILGARHVEEETFELVNPFDVGTQMQAGASAFRVHPFWAPVNRTYRLPEGGKDLGALRRVAFAGLLSGRGYAGRAVLTPVPGPDDLRRLVIAAWNAGVFEAEQENPVTRAERVLLESGKEPGELDPGERRTLDVMLEKHQLLVADFLFERIERGRARSLLLVDPGGEPPYRVAPRSFANRMLMHPASLPRYLVPAGRATRLADGTAVRVRNVTAHLTVRSTGERLPLDPLWPNLVRTSSTPRAGVHGPLVWAGRGSLEEVKGKRIEGAVVLVDFNSGYQWMNLVDFGAKAVLFAEPESILRGESENKYLTLPADIPRFWVPRRYVAQLRAMEGSEVRVDGQIVWESRRARTLVGRLPGTLKDGGDPVVVQAYYDSVSVVPERAPGGEQAAGVAALLELARQLKRYPLKKEVLFVLTPGHAQNMTGWAEWLHRHYISLDDRNRKRRVDEDYVKPAFVVHLDLTTRTRRLGVFYKGHRWNHNESPIRRVYSNFGKIHATAGKAAAGTLGYGEDFMVDAINAVAGRTWDSYVPGRFTVAQELTVNAGLYGVAYMTPDDERAWVDTPQDDPDRMDFESLYRQTRVLASVLPNVLNVGAAFGSSKVKNNWTSLKGRVVEFDPKMDFLPNRSVSGSLVWVHNVVPNKSLKGVRGDWFVLAKTDEDRGGAIFEVHGMASSGWLASGWMARALCDAYEVDPMDGEIRYAPDQGPQGSQAYDRIADMNEKEKELILVTFPCKPFHIFDLIDPIQYTTFNQMFTFDAASDSQPPAFGQTLPEPGWYVSYVEPLAIGFTRPNTRVKFTFATSALGLRGKRVALVNATEDDPEGVGYAPDEADRLTFSSFHIARDMSRLNDHRIGQLKRHGIVNHYLEELNGLTSDRLEAAGKALERLDYRRAASEARAAWGLAARVYPDVAAMELDVIKSAMLFLALLIPFAFLAERLFLAFRNITQQVGGALGIFFAFFLALRAVHPAFKVALTPLMLLIAFIIIALGVIVIGMVLSRFFEFMRQERESMQGVHRAEASQLGVGLAAFSIGVSNMRKRVLRTTLTCVTLVVLTFAVLSLTSVLTAVKQRKYSIGKPAAYNGMLFRSNSWAALAEPALRNLETELGRIAEPAPRSWFVAYQTDRQAAVEIAHGDKARATAVAALGVVAAERRVTGMHRILTAGRWFREGDEKQCLLPQRLAATLFIGPGDVGKARVVIFGVPFTVAGLFDPARLGRMRDLDDEEITPVNFEATEKRRQSENLVLHQEGLLPQRYDHHDASQLVILQHDELMRLGGRLASIAVPFRDPDKLQTVVNSLLRRLGLLVYVGKEEKTYAYSAIGSTSTGGLDFLVVPVLVAALIVFSTMLGAVQERTREIGVFSSVGLAPNHVAILFFAEACVYAILGAVIGYLIGQAFSHLIVTGKVFQGLNVNYSSGAALVAVMVVMAVVLVSTAYPALLASRLARPSRVTGFDLPPLVGDRVRLELPFSFNARDAEAIGAFLAEFFEAHEEASAGEFSSGFIRLRRTVERRGRNVWHLSVRVWLAPYDFGVSQDLAFQVREGIGDESSAGLVITRLSGDQASWRRVNARFLKGIRKQFLIWRALSEPARVGYQKRARALAARPAAGPEEEA